MIAENRRYRPATHLAFREMFGDERLEEVRRWAAGELKPAVDSLVRSCEREVGRELVAEPGGALGGFLDPVMAPFAAANPHGHGGEHGSGQSPKPKPSWNWNTTHRRFRFRIRGHGA